MWPARTVRRPHERCVRLRRLQLSAPAARGGGPTVSAGQPSEARIGTPPDPSHKGAATLECGRACKVTRQIRASPSGPTSALSDQEMTKAGISEGTLWTASRALLLVSLALDPRVSAAGATSHWLKQFEEVCEPSSLSAASDPSADAMVPAPVTSSSARRLLARLQPRAHQLQSARSGAGSALSLRVPSRPLVSRYG